METTREYRIFGILIWSVTTRTAVVDEDAVYQRLSQRFSDEMKAALDAAAQRLR